MGDDASMITGQTTMLYYADLGAARAFYGEVLALEVDFEDTWVSLYRTTPTSSLGVVGEHPSAFHRPQAKSAVMLSLVVEHVDPWFQRLQSGGAKILKPPYDHLSVPIRAFLAEDPGGYAIEFFAWRT